jgi:tetratricopeptide (TPR) repeat protein
LAIIRDGDLDAGGREIEIAASLDPNNSIIRSYLGKTYFEKKQTGLDEREYAIAKELDPNDPTPWFYDAIAKQTTNRPVEALRDFEKSIELNDNRKVYRSRLLLDSDEAARSAATARIYSDLGFQQLALVEGYKSVNTDPTNHSAHRFLADSYSIRPRHEIARVSELLQSQLLQPNNITPIQPRLAESNQFLIAAQGPGSLSFNEFNPIFNRNRVAVQGSGLVAEDDTYGGEGVLSGIYKRFSFSGGYTYFDTDGWRENADQNDKIANIFAQYELNYKTSIQTEFRYRDSERGDVELLFWEDNIAERDFFNENSKSLRFGLKHSFSPNSTLIGNLAYNDVDSDSLNLFFIDPQVIGGPPPPPFLEDFFSADTEEDAYSGELQHLFRSQYVNTVAGAGYFNIDQEIDIVEDVFFTGIPLFSVPDEIDLEIDHYNVYLYSYINLLKDVTFTIGASGDFFDADDQIGEERDLDENQFNPKFGITWNPLQGTTLRGAVFRTLKRTLITDQTLEPTQVAGFNQFFDDFNATKAWVYGAAVDQKFKQNIYGGAEFFYRDMEVPFFGQTAPAAPFEFLDTDWEEYIGRAYLFWTPHKWFGLSAEYQYEKFERTDEFDAGIREVETHAVPLGINFFHPSGVSAGLKATYYDQEGEFIRKEFLNYETGDDTFWVVDAAISYRLPKRYGFLTLGATNLLDESFDYADTDVDNPKIQPERSIFGKVTIALP